MLTKTYQLLILFFSITTFSQSPNILWQKTYGGTSFDLLYDFVALSDGNYLLIGYSGSSASGNCTESTNGISDYWVVKVDNDGNILWQNKYGGNERDNLFSAIETPDGGYLLLGQSLSSPSGDKTAPLYGSYDIWAIKIDSNGNIVWDKTYGGDNLEFINSGIATSYGYILCGYSLSGISGNKTTPNLGSSDIWIIGIDFAGNILWEQTYGGSDGDRPYDIINTSDNNILISGVSNSSNSGHFGQNNYGNNDYWILKLDLNGNLLWQQNYGGSGFDEARRIVETSNQEYIAVGFSNSPISGIKNSLNYGADDIWIIKTDSNGNLLWENSYGGDAYDAASNIIKLNNGYFITGSSLSGISGNKTEVGYGDYDFWGLKIDENGTIVWQKSIGGSLSDGCNSIVKNPDGTFLLAGSSRSPVSGTKTVASYGDSDYWLVKLDEDVLNTTIFNNNTFAIYPNPVKNILNIDFENYRDKIVITFFNLLGQEVFTNSYSHQKEIKIGCNNLQDGIYNIIIETNNDTFYKKLIKTN